VKTQESGARYRAALATARIGIVRADGTRPGVPASQAVSEPFQRQPF